MEDCKHLNRNVYDDGYWNCPDCSENGNIDFPASEQSKNVENSVDKPVNYSV